MTSLFSFYCGLNHLLWMKDLEKEYQHSQSHFIQNPGHIQSYLMQSNRKNFKLLAEDLLYYKFCYRASLLKVQ